MKKTFLILLLFAFVLNSCQNDDTNVDDNSKIRLLQLKSKEFAKKYNVNVTLNEDSIIKYYKEMTVESMEEDYRNFARLKDDFSNNVVQGPQQTSVSKVSKKSFIKRRKVETETPSKPDDGRDYPKSGVFSGSGRSTNSCCDEILKWGASVNWKYEGNVTTIVKLSVICDSNAYCCRKHLCDDNCKSTQSLTDNNVPGYCLDGKVSFSGGTTFNVSVCAYRLKVVVNYAYSDGFHSINVTL